MEVDWSQQVSYFVIDGFSDLTGDVTLILTNYVQPGTLILNPGNAEDWNGKTYVQWNPVRYMFPTGHAKRKLKVTMI